MSMPFLAPAKGSEPVWRGGRGHVSFLGCDQSDPHRSGWPGTCHCATPPGLGSGVVGGATSNWVRPNFSRHWGLFQKYLFVLSVHYVDQMDGQSWAAAGSARHASLAWVTQPDINSWTPSFHNLLLLLYNTYVSGTSEDSFFFLISHFFLPALLF